MALILEEEKFHIGSHLRAQLFLKTLHQSLLSVLCSLSCRHFFLASCTELKRVTSIQGTHPVCVEQLSVNLANEWQHV